MMEEVCARGCSIVEDIYHMAWQCPQAQSVWREVLRPWERLLQRSITWEDVVQASGVRLPRSHAKRGQAAIRYAWTITRGCVLHTLWLDRNARWSEPEEAPVTRIALLARIAKKIEIHWNCVKKALWKEEKSAWIYIDTTFPNLKQGHLAPSIEAPGRERPSDVLRPPEQEGDRDTGHDRRQRSQRPSRPQRPPGERRHRASRLVREARA
jgi:hypothetical protein